LQKKPKKVEYFGENLQPVFRFAPSPTGFLHVGGARTAIFNWLLAQKTGGKFLLRIEDTDKARSTREAIEQIFNSLQWLGLNWDERVYFQSEQRSRHISVARSLLDRGKAYRCFCTKEKLNEKRRRAETLKINQRYDGTCRHLTQKQIEQNLKQGKPFALRFKVEPGEVAFKDLIHGITRVNNAVLDDFIILRSDGSPVYQLAVVADDHDMGITTVLRGDDHIANTNKQILIYRALNWPVPEYGHLPLILGPDKIRLSKRHGAASVEEFRKSGILPEALFNYLCLLGWAPGDDREILNRSELSRIFSVERIHHTSAVFDVKKLYWLNSKYIAALPQKELWRIANDWLAEKGLTLVAQQQERFRFYTELLQPRSKTLQEFKENLSVFFNDPESYEDKGAQKYFAKQTYRTILMRFYEIVKSQPPSLYANVQAIEGFIREFAEAEGVSAAKVIHPLRLALTGKTTSPGIFEMIYILGRKKLHQRLNKALQFAAKVGVE